MAATAKKQVVRRGIASNQFEYAELLGARELESGNLVLVFEHAEVVMPGNWRLSQDLCIGDFIVAYWDEDGRFHLEFAA